MEKDTLILPHSCRIPKQFLAEMIWYLKRNLKHCEGSVHSAIVSYDEKLHIGILDLNIGYTYSRFPKFLKRTTRREAIFILTLDRGWDWINLEYANISGKEFREFKEIFETFIHIARNRKMFWQDFNPSSRES